jgi:Zn-dependent M28 family amino/carboxypeptidase
LGLNAPPVLVWAVALAGSVVGGWWVLTELLNQLAWRGHYSPGAHDNASGVGVVLALAEHFARNPPQGISLGFLFTGAEETGMHGAAAFAAGLKPGDGTAVLNFDMVGAGNALCVVEGDGTLWPLRTDARLNARLRAARPEARRLWYTLRSGDFLPFLRRGVRATSLQTSGSGTAELGYHTLRDTLDVIDVSALDMTAQTALRAVTEWNA